MVPSPSRVTCISTRLVTYAKDVAQWLSVMVVVAMTTGSVAVEG